jgi:hypothetical protein
MMQAAMLHAFAETLPWCQALYLALQIRDLELNVGDLTRSIMTDGPGG